MDFILLEYTTSKFHEYYNMYLYYCSLLETNLIQSFCIQSNGKLTSFNEVKMFQNTIFVLTAGSWKEWDVMGVQLNQKEDSIRIFQGKY